MTHQTIVLLLFAALASPAIRQQQAAPPQTSPVTAEQQQQIAKTPVAGDDKRVKAENIDTVMADKSVFFLDVREPREIEELGSYEGFVNIPVTQLEKRLGELPRNKTILTA